MINSEHTVSIMDIHFLNTTKADFLNDQLAPRLLNHNKCFIVTANPEIVMKTREDAAYKAIVKSADYVIPDGAGILLAAKHMKNPLQERIPGYDLMMDLLSFAEQEGLSCYFLGAKQAVNKKAVTQVKEQFPKLKIAGHHDGFFKLDEEQVAHDIKNTSPDIIFVALGLPRQEQWIAKYMNDFSKGLFMGVGGSFDVLAGEVKRAPQFWIRLNLEWFYRLVKQPSRLKRIFKVFEFILRVFLEKKSPPDES